MSISNTQDEPTLRETLPASLVSVSWRNHIIALGIPLALTYLAISIGAGLHSGWQAAILVPLVFCVPSAILVLAFASVSHHYLTTQIPTVELRNDELTVLYGERKLSARVTECNLRRGRGIGMRLIGGVNGMRLVGGVKLYSWLPVILIDFPPHRNPRIGMRRAPSSTAAVGYSSDMQSKWERALLQCTANQTWESICAK